MEDTFDNIEENGILDTLVVLGVKVYYLIVLMVVSITLLLVVL